MNFHGAIFDLDGTLLDSMYVWRQIDIDFLGKRGFSVPDDYLDQILTLGSLDAANYTIRRFHLDERPEAVIKEWLRMAAYEYGHCVKLKPGADRYLAELHNKNVLMAIATSAEEDLFYPALEHLGLTHMFDAIVTTKEAKAGKDKPDVYMQAARKLGLSPCECVTFEDIYLGICSAKAAGFFTVAVEDETSFKDRAALKKAADYYIADFHQLRALPPLFLR